MKLKARFVASLAVFGLIAMSGCGDDGGTTAEGPVGSSTGQSTTTLAPLAGRPLTRGTYSEAQSVDPVKNTGSGTTGNTELAAIYDVLVRYNPETRRFDMRTAESVQPNADSTVWTVKLRSGIKFG